jgi:hypothetical protein
MSTVTYNKFEVRIFLFSGLDNWGTGPDICPIIYIPRALQRPSQTQTSLTFTKIRDTTGLWVSSRVYLDRFERRSGLYDTAHPTSRFRFPATPSELLSTARTLCDNSVDGSLEIGRATDGIMPFRMKLLESSDQDVIILRGLGSENKICPFK